jgi:hypothetical protein
MTWGDESWSIPYWGASAISDVAFSRLLMFVRRDPVFRDLVAVFADRAEANMWAVEAIRSAFDLETAVGDQLDKIGGILQRPRLPGYSDDRYRTILRIQVLLILASQGTTATVLEVVERFTGAPALHYAEHYPMGFPVGAAVAPADTTLLVQLLNEARSAAYNGTLVVSEPDSDLLVMDFAGDPITGAGLMDFAGDPITGAGLMSYAITF